MARLITGLFQEQPRAFYMVFMLELWERFGFYTVQGILILYFIRYLGFSEEQAYFTFGAFFALIYGMVALGGYLGDKVLGTKRTIILGLIVLAIGYLGLAIASQHTIFYALSIICIGNGLFKANPSSLLAKCYTSEDRRLYGGFTLYYMAINLGAFAALFVGPFVSSHFGYFYAYFLSFLGMIVGLGNYYLQRNAIAEINSPVDRSKIPLWTWGLIIVGIISIVFCSSYLLQQVNIARKIVWIISFIITAIYFFYLFCEKRRVAMRMLLAFILMLEAILFFILYQQMPTSLNLFAVNNVHATLLGISIDPQSFQALNPIWIILLSPVLAMLYATMNRREISFPIPYKFALGMTSCGISFLLLFFSRYFHDQQGMVSSYWLVTSYLFQSLGELFVSALGVAMVAELVPQQISGFVMGMWFLTSSVAGFIGASVASYTALPKTLAPGVGSLMIYTNLFAWIGLVTLGIACLLWIFSPRLCRMMET